MKYNDTIKVGFGPITQSNSFHQSGIKVGKILQKYGEFQCGFFRMNPFSLEKMMLYDVLIFIKYYPPLAFMVALKKASKILILDYQDMFLYPSVYEEIKLKRILKKIYYYKDEKNTKKQLSKFDLCFVASPVLLEIVKESGISPYFLQRQLYNDKNEKNYKNYSAETENINIYWTGVGANQGQNIPILPVLKRLKEKYGCNIIYSTDMVGTEDFIEYRQWDRNTWEDELVAADIAFRWRDTSNLQRCKDANKVMAYMGAALPAVIYPTESEKLIIKDRQNGFFAFDVEEFEKIMTDLVTCKNLRKEVGIAAHEWVWENYSLEKHVAEIAKVIKNLISQIPS